MSVLNHPTLVLNKSYTPIHVTTVRQSVLKVSLGVADIVDHEDYSRYEWDEWIMLPVVGDQKFIKTTQGDIRAPQVVIVKHYNQVPEFGVKLTRRNIYIRDGGKCQYTGKDLKLSESTLDHIQPESRGGGNTWSNLVLCDRDVNMSKANRTPEEAGLTLSKEPKKPGWTPLYKAGVGNVPEAWLPFLPKIKK